MNKIRLLKLRIAMWLMKEPLTVTEIMLREEAKNRRCPHCGKNLYVPFDEPTNGRKDL